MLNDEMRRTTLMYNFLKIKNNLQILKSPNASMYDYWVQIYEAMLENEACYVIEFILKTQLSGRKFTAQFSIKSMKFKCGKDMDFCLCLSFHKQEILSNSYNTYES